MKRADSWLLSLCLPLCLFAGCQGEPPLPSSADIKVMSWNILNPTWGGGPVEFRRDAFVEIVCEQMPDVLGLQEASKRWHEVFDQLPASYEAVNATTDGGKEAMTTLFYNTDTLTLISNGIEDLDSGSDIRIVSWAILEANGTTARFLVTNTHPDAREATCIPHTEQHLKLVNALQKEHDLPLLCVGDFNAVEDSTAYRLHINDGFTDCKYADGVEVLQDVDSYLMGDYGGHVTRGKGSRDHVFFKGAVTPLTFTTLTDDGVKTVSDHLPVVATVQIGE